MILLCSILLILLRSLRYESVPLMGCRVATRLETIDLTDVFFFSRSPCLPPFFMCLTLLRVEPLEREEVSGPDH